MKAVILAGGFGTRLRPLTCTRPKLLFPIGNKPLLDWTLERLAKNGIKEVILAVNYMADAFIQRYGESSFGMKISYSREDKPLGTGGPIKRAEKLIGHEEDFLVLNGDVFTDINYKKLVKKHREDGAIATIAIYKVADPSRYGVVEITERNRVTRFVEKPTREMAPSNMVNAGIYVFNPKIFDYIPEDRSVSTEHEIFPKLADEGNLYGYFFEGMWVDIGKPEDYLEANKLLLNIKMRGSQFGENISMKDVEIEDPVVIGNQVTIEDGSKIGPYVAIGDHVSIGRGVRLVNSIIFAGTTIADFTSIKGAIVGENAILGRWVKVEEGCIIGDHAMILDNVTLTQGVSVCPSKEVSESVLKPIRLM